MQTPTHKWEPPIRVKISRFLKDHPNSSQKQIQRGLGLPMGNFIHQLYDLISMGEVAVSSCKHCDSGKVYRNDF